MKPIQVNQAAIRDAVRRATFDNLPAVLSLAALYYLILGLCHALPFGEPRVLSYVALLSAALILVGRHALMHRWVNISRCELLIAGLAAIVLGNGLLALGLFPVPQQTTSLLVFIVAAGCVMLSTPMHLVAVLAALVGWGMIVWHRPPYIAWVPFGVALLAASIISVVIQTIRSRHMWRVEQLRIEERSRARELETALLETRREIEDRARIEQSLIESNRQLNETLAQLRAMQRQLVQQERLRALGEMASGIAHDFNNTLSPILGYSELLLKSELPEPVCEKLRWIHTGAQDAAAVVERLQTFYRGSHTIRLRRVRLPSLVQDVVQLTRPKWHDQAMSTGRSIEVRTDLRETAKVWGDPSELRDLLTNLVLNAVDAMPAGGRITISTRASGTMAALEVADTGVGMTAEVRTKCLEPFFTTKGATGSGLGLSVCHGIVERHGGRMEIESAEGAGTRVRVLLPTCEQHELGAEGEARQQLPSLRGLYIDDDPRVRSVVALMLEELGQKVELAESGPAGLEMFQHNHYDFVITDYCMPQMDGRELVRRLRSIRKDVPVILISGWKIRDASSSNDLAPNYFLDKPPTLEKLRFVVSELGRISATSELGQTSGTGGTPGQ